MTTSRVPKERAASRHFSSWPTRCASDLASRCTEKKAVGPSGASGPSRRPRSARPTRVVASLPPAAVAASSRDGRHSSALPTAQKVPSTRSFRAAISRRSRCGGIRAS